MKPISPAALAIAALLASPAFAQQSTTPAPADNVATLLGAPAPTPASQARTSAAASTDAALELKGETNAPAPDSEQNPAELSITARLNSEVAARDELADQTDRANQAAYARSQSEYKEAVADRQAEIERQAIDTQINAQSRAEYNAEQEDRYQKAMADWRATVAACDRGDASRCRAGSMPARPGT